MEKRFVYADNAATTKVSKEVLDAMKECETNLIELITKTIENINPEHDCECHHLLNGAIV